MKNLLKKTFLTSPRSVRLCWIFFLITSLIFCLDGSINSFPQKSHTRAGNSIIEFTFVPSYGSSDNLIGQVRNVDINAYKVAVYIFIEGAGWWTKPTFSQPLTSINNDSTWTCDITTGGGDIYATRIRAFLLPSGINPPEARGLACIPVSLDSISIANAFTERAQRTISFSGHEWWVKASVGPVGPGPNYFSNSTENVLVDEQEQLHLRITQSRVDSQIVWNCAEVTLKESLV